MCITCICKVVYIFINTVIYHFIYHSKNITYLFGIQYFICIFVVQKRTQKGCTLVGLPFLLSCLI